MAIIFQLEDGPVNVDSANPEFGDSKKNYIIESRCDYDNSSNQTTNRAGTYSVLTNKGDFYGQPAAVGENSHFFAGGPVIWKRHRYSVRNAVDGYEINYPAYLKCSTIEQSNTSAGTQTGTPSSIYTRSGVDFTVTTKRYKHSGDLSAAVANPRIVSELGTGWEIADWTDFSSFTEDDFLGMLRILGPLAPSPKTCHQLLVEVNGNLEWNLGWILAFGNGNRGSSYSWFWTFANRKKAPWYARQGSYLNDFVIYGGWNPTYPYLCKRTGSSLPNTKGGCF